MTRKLWIDLETYSETPISYGTYKYAENAQVLLFAYAIDDEPARVIDCTDDNGLPLPLSHTQAETFRGLDCEWWAHNSMFDRTVLRYNGLEVPIKNWRDTMVQALEHGLPANLGGLCHVLGIAEDQTKLSDGRRLVLQFCKPQADNRKIKRATKVTHPDDWAHFVEYARLDVEAMRACHYRMPQVNYPAGHELDYWHIDQHINDHGFNVDTRLVEGAIELHKREAKRLNSKTVQATSGVVDAATKRDKLLQHIMSDLGYPLPDLKKDTIQRRLEDDNIPGEVAELLRLRLQASSTSVSKYTSLAKAVNRDGRCRGTIQFHGAKRTGRAAGRTFQPQNLPSRGLLPGHQIDYGIELMRNDLDPDIELYPNRMKLLSSAVRGALIASGGKKLIVADLANIEGRFAAWVTGEAWKIDAFKAYDDGTGPDLYKSAYARAFNTGIDDVTYEQRQIGKVMELMLQYGGGVGAFFTGAETSGFDIEELAENVWGTLPAREKAEGQEFMEWYVSQGRSTFGLSVKGFVTCDVLKRLWRKANPAISAVWKKLEAAVLDAMGARGRVAECGDHIKLLRKGNYLYIRLPSGRCLTYPGPKINDNDQLTFMGDNPYSRKYTRLATYGGKLFENICQAGSRDVLYACKAQALREGYQIVMHVHDELITEAPDTGDYTVQRLSEIMQGPFDWAKGLPLAAAGFETYRYKKG